MEQKKETEAEMKERLRKEIEAEKPEDITPKFDVGGGNAIRVKSNDKAKSSGGGYNIFGWKPLATIFIISMIVAYLVVAFVGVSGTKWIANNRIINSDIITLQSQVKTLQAQLAADEATIKILQSR